LKTDSFVSPSDQGDEFILHNSNLLFYIDVRLVPPCCVKVKSKRNHIPIIYGTMFRLQHLGG
jgi:hypothetical protein